MSVLYRPVLIESAEQAEALPDGIIAMRANRWPLQKSRGVWPTAWGTFLGWELVGWTALVPVETEEEFQDIDAYEASGHMRRHHLTRYTTPWEAAS